MPGRRGKLTDLQVRKLVAKGKPGMHGDGAGLWLCITSPNAASWVMRYQLAKQWRDGRPPKINPRTSKPMKAAQAIGLGPYGDVSLERAREKLEKYREALADGRDPVAVREAEAAARAAEAAKSKTFKEVAEGYINSRKAAWTGSKTAAQWTASLQRYAFPAIGAVAVQDVSMAMVTGILEPIWGPKCETADRVRRRIEAVLDYAKAKEWRTGENVARWKGHLDKVFPKRSDVQKVEHSASMPYARVPGFLETLAAAEGNGAVALRFTILTACRTNDVLGARWDEFDLAEGSWTLPADRHKTRKEFRVPLAAEAMAILREQENKTGGAGFVFPGAKTGRPLSNMAMLKVLERLNMPFDTHGFRSSFADWAAEKTSFPQEIREASLSHAVGDKVMTAYMRTSFFDKRRKLMDAWARFCSKGSNVVDMRVAASR